jgi:hypothetical protein
MEAIAPDRSVPPVTPSLGNHSFAILFRELSAEQKGKLLERAQGWPEPLAKQVARTARAAEHSAEERQKLLIPLVDRSCSAPRLIATLLRFRPSFPFEDSDSVLIPATIDVRFA